MNKELVSIISVNYNQAEVTCAMLASLRCLTYSNYEIIIIDNASPTENPLIIKERFPEIQLIQSEKNLGFAGGNNLGILAAQGKYCLFLNNDTEVSSNLLDELVMSFEQNSAIGIITPKIIFYDSDNLIQYAGSSAINPWTGRSVTVGNQEKDLGQYDGEYQTALAHGAAMMVPMQVIREVGLMPELYFLYYEEMDWCEMIKRAGYIIHYVGKASIYHKESVSVGRSSVMRTYYMYRNRLLFIRRNSIGIQRWSGILFFLLFAAPKQSVVHLLRKETEYVIAIWRGVAWHLKGIAITKNRFLSTRI